MRVPFFDVTRQHARLREPLREALDRVVASGHFILGEAVASFEAAMASYVGVPHAIGCASGTDALILAMQAFDVGPGHEVITTPWSFFATAGAIARLGATPVFCDIDPGTFNLDAEKLEALVTKRTRAVMPVHLYGLSADMGKVMEVARAHDLVVIEDACQAIGATCGGAKVGTIGDIGCFSFFPTKNLGGAGDGGMVTTRDAKVALRVRRLRVHGSADRTVYPEVGMNSRLDALQAAFLQAKLPFLAGWEAGRRENAAFYDRALSGLPLRTPREPAGRRHVYNQYTCRAAEREPLRKHLSAAGVETAVYYPAALHLQPCFARLGHRPGDCPEAEAAAREAFSLPIFPELEAVEREAVAAAVRSFYGR